MAVGGRKGKGGEGGGDKKNAFAEWVGEGTGGGGGEGKAPFLLFFAWPLTHNGDGGSRWKEENPSLLSVFLNSFRLPRKIGKRERKLADLEGE